MPGRCVNMNNITPAERLAAIKNLLAEHPRGLSVNEISSSLQRHRNSVSRDLHALSLSGQVIQQAFGTTRIYSLAQRPPISNILHYTSDMALILDGNDTILSANSPLLSYLGCNPEDIEGRSIHEQEHSLLKTLCTSCIGDTTQGSFSSSTLAISAGEGISHLKMKKIPTVFDDGTAGSIFLIEDITGEVLSSADLKTSEAMYRAIVESLIEMVIRFLPDGTEIFSNRAYQSYFNLPSSDQPEPSFFSKVEPADREMLRSHLSVLSRENPDITVTFRVHRRDRTTAWNTWTFHGVFDKEGLPRAYQGIGRDITLELEAKEHETARSETLHALSSKTVEFLGMDSKLDLYRIVGRNLAAFVPGSLAMVFSCEDDLLSFTLKAINQSRADSKDQEIIPLDESQDTCTFENHDTEYRIIKEALLSGSLVDTGGSLFRYCTSRMGEDGDADQGLSVEGLHGYSAGLVAHGTLRGAAELFNPVALSPQARSLINAYLGIASLALDGWISRKTLDTSEERFIKVATTNPLPISILDGSGRYLYLSPRFTELFGYSLNDIPSGKEWFMHAFPDLAEQTLAKKTWKHDLTGSFSGDGQPRHFRVRCKDGNFKSILFMPVCLSGGQQMIVYEDITPRLEATQTRNLLSDIIRSSHDGIFSATIDGRVLTWNPAAERIYGYTAEEVEGKDVHMLEPPHLKGEIASILDRVRQGEYIVQHETQRVRKDGRTIDVSLTISPVYQEDGGIMGASTIVRDISAQKAEERLRDLEMKYQGLVNNINVGVYRSTGDPRGRFIWGNTSLIHILGYKSLDDLKEIAVSDFFARSTGREELLAELKQHGFVKNMEITLRRGDGRIIHVLVTALATFNPDGSISHINGIVEDVSDQRLLEQKVANLYHPGADQNLLPTL